MDFLIYFLILKINFLMVLLLNSLDFNIFIFFLFNFNYFNFINLRNYIIG